MKYYAQKFKSVIISFQIVFTSITAFYLLGDLYDLAGLTPPFFTKRKRGLDCVSRSAKAPNKVRTRMWRGPRLFSMSHIAARSHPLWRGPSFFLSKGLLMCPSHLHWWEERKGKGESSLCCRPVQSIFIYHKSFNHPNKFIMFVLLFGILYRWENDAMELPKFTQLISDRAGVWTWGFWYPSP